ncbi:MAG: DUF4012 domain-containing protein [Candidatus Moraniibacteriota bacterium]
MVLSVLSIIILLVTVFVFTAFRLRDGIMSHGAEGAKQLERAVRELKGNDLTGSQESFVLALKEFESAQKLLTGWGTLVEALRFIPGLEKPASGKNLVDAGVHLARAGGEFNLIATLFAHSSAQALSGNGLSFLDLLKAGDPHMKIITQELKSAETSLSRVRSDVIPPEERAHFLEMRDGLPDLLAGLDLYLQHAPLFEELLGGNGPRQYLFLFQNNHELRATGGFIGSYALLDIANGSIRRFFIDGIFNPDGQLKENIIPPKPIQKISAAWSLHDSNWFPDFPVSAEKAIFFYEKTGGATVDGVITFTPTILERLLEVTGPIDLPQYGVVVNHENFMTIVQEEVEVKYDREENNPKKILGDLMNAILGHLLLAPDQERFQKIASLFVSGLNERHILLYSRHPETEALIDGAGWSGRILSTPHDYLSVIHSNINGYKTDGVVDDNITHESEIQSDGSIIDTVAVTRKHNGGHTPYEWWNKVSADYMRVYVPEGAELLSAEGMTREDFREPLDYAALGFHADPDVKREEDAWKIDPETGTRIGRDAGKTVFGNWVYVSPGESVTVKYRYRLKEHLSLQKMSADDPISYSVLVQKQAGTEGTQLSLRVSYPEGFDPVWQTGENLVPYGRTYSLSTSLDENQFFGLVLKKK